MGVWKPPELMGVWKPLETPELMVWKPGVDECLETRS